MEEIWKNIDHPDLSDKYEVSNKGYIRSIGRIITVYRVGSCYERNVPSKELAMRVIDGLLAVSLVGIVTGTEQDEVPERINTTRYLHKEVAKVFLPNPDPKLYISVEHIDGNIHNNNVNNLKWITEADSIKKTQEVRTEENRNFLGNLNKNKSIVNNITKEEIKKVQDLYKTNSGRVIAKKLGYSLPTVYKILRTYGKE